MMRPESRSPSVAATDPPPRYPPIRDAINLNRFRRRLLAVRQSDAAEMAILPAGWVFAGKNFAL
jgi:hypothetical protein